ncbi:MAG: hypothetical protein B6D44_00555 [Ignavibacteriales bacterium UTCHB2]|jgi:glycosyltransferase involved in cell wall biosynthesis|nr:glycosyltransferase [Bacteroidia bacterium]OQY75938.1 MAG: hypothetical protein B6D44_00555 [Ignavibacteriales bacterium UTCHB2]
MAEVSVILPNFNHSKFLEKRISSILYQSYQDYEVIILDDCSTDNSKEIIERYRSHNRVSQIVYNDENSGSTFKQWHKGIELAQGKFIWIAESDDWAEKKFLKETVNVLRQSDSVGLVFTAFFRTNSEGAILYSNKTDYEGKIEPYKIYNGKFLVKDQFLRGNAIPNTSAVVFKKNCYEDVDKEQLFSFRYIGDWFLWIAILSKSNFVYINKELDYFRGHLENVSYNAIRNGLYSTESIKMFNYFLKNRIYDKKDKRFITNNWANQYLNSIISLTFGLNIPTYINVLATGIKYDRSLLITLIKLSFTRIIRKIKKLFTLL